MEINEKIYFNNFMNYKPRGVKEISHEAQTNIDYFSAQIRSTAKDAISELISPKIARKEISNLLDNIKQLKKEVR
jgi:hypothetical protein